MRKTACIILTAALMAAVITGCGKGDSDGKAGTAEASESETRAEVSEDAASMDIDKDTLKLTYYSSPTTGYSYTYKISDETVLQFVDDTYAQDKYTADGHSTEGLCGVAGKETFTFKGLKKGTAVITFDYGRQWDGGEKEEPFDVTVEVGNDGEIISAK